MTTPTETPTEALGGQGETCAGCGASLATDQRYCLNCGLRRAEARLPFADIAGERREAIPAAPPAPPPKPPTAWIAAAGAAFAALLIGLGALIGAVGADKELRTIQPAATPAPKPPNIVVNAGGGGEATEETLTSDWPEGKKGWTVQLQKFANDGSVPVSEVESAKSDAESKGAKDVGALNSDDFGSLDPGLYIVYSGVFTGKGGKKKANAALKKLKKDFRGAKVIKVDAAGGAAATGARSSKTVDDSELQDLAGSTGEEQQKKSAKLPDELELEGKPPPKDNKKPGGGGGGITIP